MRPTGKYRPNLVNLMNLCETNYMLILRLLADKELVGEVRHFFINEQLSYNLVVREVTRYTTLINISQEAGDSEQDFSELLRPTMEIRLYHDAKLLEVIRSQHIAHIKPRYDYPNEAMHQPDEKQQALIFLKEWLQMCLEKGQVNLSKQINNLIF
jgi:uncharacterized protein YqiB (DUF1249 family)